jgi:P4 family phage/plasmid primase-like protien
MEKWFSRGGRGSIIQLKAIRRFLITSSEFEKHKFHSIMNTHLRSSPSISFSISISKYRRNYLLHQVNSSITTKTNRQVPTQRNYEPPESCDDDSDDKLLSDIDPGDGYSQDTTGFGHIDSQEIPIPEEIEEAFANIPCCPPSLSARRRPVGQERIDTPTKVRKHGRTNSISLAQAEQENTEPNTTMHAADTDHSAVPPTFEQAKDAQNTTLPDLKVVVRQDSVLNELDKKVSKLCVDGLSFRRVVLSSHSKKKCSYHVIYKATVNDHEAMFVNKRALRYVYDLLQLGELVDHNHRPVIDAQVYNDGCLRAIHCSKTPTDVRPFEFTHDSMQRSDLESFVGYFSLNNTKIIFEEYASYRPGRSGDLDNESRYEEIRLFLVEKFKISTVGIESVTRLSRTAFRVGFHDDPCKIANRKHKSNRQYVTITTKVAIYGCWDEDCRATPKESTKVIPATEYTMVIMELFKPEIPPDVKKECQEHIEKTTGDRTGSWMHDFLKNELVTKITKNITHQFGWEGGDHVLTPYGQLFRYENGEFKLRVDPQTIPSVITNFLVVNVIQNYFAETEQSTKTIVLDEKIFNDEELTALWNSALSESSEVSLAQIIAHDEKTLAFSRGVQYFFTGSLWFKDENVSRTTCYVYQKLVKGTTKIISSQGGHDADVQKSICKLKTIYASDSGLKHIVHLASCFLEDIELYNLLDSRIDLIPFDNGAYSIPDRLFRDYRRDDFVTKTLGYCYDPAANNTDVHRFLSDILPGENVRDYLLKLCSDSLDPSLPNNIFTIMIGSGSNGKSVFLYLLQKTFGSLWENVSATLFTRKEPDPTAATPGIAKLASKRCVTVSELEEGSKLNATLMKRCTGKDTHSARFMRCNEFSFVLYAHFFLACNNLPEISGSDPALWTRIRLIPFLQRFVECPKTPNEKKLDPRILSKIDSDITWRQTFLNILIGLLGVEKSDETIPHEVLAKTTRYRQDNDMFGEWLNDNLVVETNHLLTLQEILTAYGVENVIGNRRKMGTYRKDISNFLQEHFNIPEENYSSRRVGKGKKVCWMGIRLRKEDDKQDYEDEEIFSHMPLTHGADHELCFARPNSVNEEMAKTRDIPVSPKPESISPTKRSNRSDSFVDSTPSDPSPVISLRSQNPQDLDTTHCSDIAHRAKSACGSMWPFSSGFMEHTDKLSGRCGTQSLLSWKERDSLAKKTEKGEKWLEDVEIRAALNILAVQHPNVGGFTDPVMMFESTQVVENAKYDTSVYILYSDNHWVAATHNSRQDNIMVYDSRLPENLRVRQGIVGQLKKVSTKNPLSCASASQQKEGWSCGLYAIANVVEFLEDGVPGRSYDEAKMSVHFATCLRTGIFTRFP